MSGQTESQGIEGMTNLHDSVIKFIQSTTSSLPRPLCIVFEARTVRGSDDGSTLLS